MLGVNFKKYSLLFAFGIAAVSGYALAARKNPSPDPKLAVERVEQAHFPQIAETARSWSEAARERVFAASGPEKEIFIENSHANGKIAELLSRPVSGLEAYVCRDGRGKIQGLMVACERGMSLYVDYLATHPKNIRAEVNPAPERVGGAGTALIEQAVARALELKKKMVSLDFLESAWGFYSKLGFSENGYRMEKSV